MEKQRWKEVGAVYLQCPEREYKNVNDDNPGSVCGAL